MADTPKVGLLLYLVDKLTQPIEGARSAVGKFGASLKGLGNEAMELLNNKLIQGVGFAGMVTGLKGAFEASDRFRVATQQLEGTAKITGVSLGWLQGIAEDAGKKFGLSKVQASDFAVEMAKLATKAGDVGAAAPALEAFLNIGAARGLTAAETLKRVQQAVLGIDEGTDALFSANPSVLYAMYAESIGTTAGKLSDQEKAQALLTAAMEDGGKVTGQYSAWLETVAGKAAMAANALEEANAKLGESLGTLRTAMSDAKVFGADLLTGIVQAVQLAGEWIGAAFLIVPMEIKLLWISLLTGVASGIVELGKLIPFVGEKISDAGRLMLAKHRETGQQLIAQMNEYKGFHEAAQADILGIDIDGAQQRSDVALDAATAARAAAKKAAADKKKAEERAAEDSKAGAKKSAAELAELQKLYAAQGLSTLQAQHLSYEQLVAAFQARMKSMTVEDQEKAQAILDKHGSRLLDIWNKKYAGMTATVVGFTQGPMHGLMTNFEALPKVAEPALQFIPRMQQAAGELGPAMQDAADDIGAFANALGISNPAIESALAGVSQLGDALGKFGTGDYTGALVGAIGGVASILGGIFGDSPESKARKEILLKNTQRLAELKDRMGELLSISTPGGKIAKFRDVDTDTVVSTAQGRARDPQNRGRISVVGLGSVLNGMGLTMTDMRELAKDLGIDLGESDGFMDGDMVRQFFNTVKSGQFVGFGTDSFAGKMDKNEFLNGILGVEGDGALASMSELFKDPKTGSTAFASIFDGINLYDGIDDEERKVMRGRLGILAQRFASGAIGANELGGLSNTEAQSVFTKISDMLGTPTAATGAAPAGAGTGTAAGTDSASVFASATTGPSGVADSTSPALTYLSEIAVNTLRTADNTDALVMVARDIANSTAATAAGLADGGVARRVDEALRLSRDLTTVSTGA